MVRAAVVLLSFLLPTWLSAQDPVVEFAMEPCLTGLDGPPSGRLGFEVHAVIRVTESAQLGGPGAIQGIQGWSISIAAENVEILEVTTRGTVAADAEFDPVGIREFGFEKSETAYNSSGDCEGRPGAVSAVVLSFSKPVVLPIEADHTVLQMVVGGSFPGSGSKRAFLGFVNGCYGGG